MRRTLAYSKKCVKEILRDPLSYIFLLGFPVLMLLLMTLVNRSIGSGYGPTMFKPENLTPGIVVFSLSFTMLLAALTVSRDRGTSFVLRLGASPMKRHEFLMGYTLPFVVISLLQTVVTFVFGVVMGAWSGYTFSFPGILLAVACSIPCSLVFIAFGMIFSIVFSEKAAPPACSIIISLTGILGGIWMDTEKAGAALAWTSRVLPFSHMVNLLRRATALGGDMLTPLLVTCGYAVALFVVAALLFRYRLFGKS
ncbi:MAG: ABC transporter permease [Clostridia bacterium]|nr:ABC transporter permease [Clostridia bacterium]MBR6289801.1 ABC transporter permease [Clostridia bacterium]